MRRKELIDLLTATMERSAERLRAKGHDDPWPEDLRARDIVRLLRERSREIAQRIYEEDDR